MKQSFTLKAVALGLAAVATLGASAVRPQVPKEAPRHVSSPIVEEFAHNGKVAARTSASARIESAQNVMASRSLPFNFAEETNQSKAASRAIESYGPWEDAGTLEYTFTQLYKNGMVKEAAMVKTYPYQKRSNKLNTDQFQIKVSNWGEFTAAESAQDVPMPGSELLLTVTPTKLASGETVNVVSTETTGVNLGWECTFRVSETQTVDVPMYYYDCYTFVKTLATFQPSVSSSVVEAYNGMNIYNAADGSFKLVPIYGGPSTDSNLYDYSLDFGDYTPGLGITNFWYDSIKLSGKFISYDAKVDVQAGYFYRNAGETTGYYKVPFIINDNIDGVAKIVKGSFSTRDELQAAFNEMIQAIDNPTSDMAIVTSRENWLNLSVDPYEDGLYSVLYATRQDANSDYYGGFELTALSGAEYVLDGFANYTDAFMGSFVEAFGSSTASYTLESLGLPSSYTTNCQVEKSEKTPGEYRLRAPYAEYPIGTSGKIAYSQMDDYLVYNVSDPSKAYVTSSLCGIQFVLNTQNGVVNYYMGAATMAEAFNIPEFEGNYGTWADNKLTFPGSNTVVTIQGTSGPQQAEVGPLCVELYLLDDATGRLNFDGYVLAKDPKAFLIETGVVDAIENVEASTDVNAPVEYYNLQGQKVVNPAAGQLVIKKQGSKVTKMIAQ